MAATLTVASKDSLAKEKADYVCDGVDDQVEIQQAIDSLLPSGGMVELLEGTFHFGGDVEITKDDVTVKGMGRSTILKHGATEWVKLTADAEEGAETISVEDSGQFRIGQLIGISDDAINPHAEPGASYWYYRNYYVNSLVHAITRIDDNAITLDRPLESPASVATKYQ